MAKIENVNFPLGYIAVIDKKRLEQVEECVDFKIEDNRDLDYALELMLAACNYKDE